MHQVGFNYRDVSRCMVNKTLKKKLINGIIIFIATTVTQLPPHKKQNGSTSQLLNYDENNALFSQPYIPNQVSPKRW